MYLLPYFLCLIQQLLHVNVNVLVLDFGLMLEQNLRNAKTCGVLFCSFYGNVCLFCD